MARLIGHSAKFDNKFLSGPIPMGTIWAWFAILVIAVIALLALIFSPLAIQHLAQSPIHRLGDQQ